MSPSGLPLRELAVAALCTLLVGVAMAMTPPLPGDVAVARAVQALSPGTAWVPVLVSTAYAPTKFILMAIAVLGAWRLAGTRTAALVLGFIVLEQLLGEESKSIFSRPRPSPELIAVMGSPKGFSFPSTFITLYSVTVGALVLIAWRSARGAPRTAIITVGVALLVLAGAARVVPGAHWPSDVLGTYLICLSWLHAGLALIRRGDTRGNLQ
ncbi:phosphatase PAP2 family protein [Hyalangium rubrum]|uniref:Phosphatase PAP2 family protein n=1 Tax=Hyalangium rubrum TaxID=3103134 RepID=A0ABU5HHN7_9BACT|nr:phosphatase PAP2 family protein [Hyalangium sp. s54d21]MDY7232969.1 phosphatase PAP2 family protein [Hyalangium sp. s54d21]